ncbi:hypothetical protein [Sphingomonas sp.]|uniref:hypothetical protein n=1 Tax=Sphingomonas sp. TaxID=28214 RepID=UPI002DB760BF|nr:hypothetical protein [Sphingomonas sp.]HEU4970283.1 hypothetical protein [Sphingomonas sp.]
MDISNTPLVERIARVLAGQRLSSNAEGSNPSAGDVVDLAWREHLDDARAVLRTLREPDEEMAAAGDAAVWERMVRAAIDNGGSDKPNADRVEERA